MFKIINYFSLWHHFITYSELLLFSSILQIHRVDYASETLDLLQRRVMVYICNVNTYFGRKFVFHLSSFMVLVTSLLLIRNALRVMETWAARWAFCVDHLLHALTIP